MKVNPERPTPLVPLGLELREEVMEESGAEPQYQC